MSKTSEALLAWLVSAFVCLYCGFLYSFLTARSAEFQVRFEGLGVDLPWTTAFLIFQRDWLYPSIFGAAGALVLVKEFFVRDKRLTLCITLTSGIVLVLLADWIVSIYLSPMMQLINQLS